MNLQTLAQVIVVSFALAACGAGGRHGHCGGDCEGDCDRRSAGGEGDCDRTCDHDGHGEGHGHGHGHGEGPDEELALPPAVGAFHEAIAPVWHSEPGAGRSTLACNAAAGLRERAGAVQGAETPAGVEPAAWSAGTTTLVTSTDALVASCSPQAADAEVKLTSVHEAFHALIMQLRAIH